MFVRYDRGSPWFSRREERSEQDGCEYGPDLGVAEIRRAVQRCQSTPVSGGHPRPILSTIHKQKYVSRNLAKGKTFHIEYR